MIKTILRAWEDIDETVVEAIKKAQAICSKRWYAVDNIMDEFSFPAMVLIEKACPPGLMIEQVDQRQDEGEQKIKIILRDWEDLDEIVAEAIKKAQAICNKRWYAIDNIMDELSFPAMVLIEKACPPGLMVEQVEQ